LDIVFADDGVFVGADDAGALGEDAFAGAPACPDAAFEHADGELWSDDGVDDADQCLGAVDFHADIFADDGGLHVGEKVVIAHALTLYNGACGASMLLLKREEIWFL